MGDKAFKLIPPSIEHANLDLFMQFSRGIDDNGVYQKGDGLYSSQIISCMTGSIGKEGPLEASKGLQDPPTGQRCVALLENTADISADPAKAALYPRQTFSESWTELLAASGVPLYNTSPITGILEYNADDRQWAIDTAIEMGTREDTKNNTVRVRTGNEEDGKLNIYPGTAAIAGFTNVVQQAQAATSVGKAPTIPAPKRSLEELHIDAQNCFNDTYSTGVVDKPISLGTCLEVGEDLGRHYLLSTQLTSLPNVPQKTTVANLAP